MSANPTHHTCPDCFYTWEHGHDGSHSCVQRLKARISILSAALQENHEWHQQYDEHGGYPDSALEATNTNALIGAAAEWKLPCQVRLPGGMTIGKGCNLNTLLLAIRRRQGGEPWQLDFDVPIPIDSGLQRLLKPLPEQPINLLQEADYLDQRTGDETWSVNGEDWHNIGSVEELIRETDSDFFSLEVGSAVFVGTKYYNDPAEFIDHQQVLQVMNDNASQSDASEWVDSWPEPGEQAEKELKVMLESWARRHCPPDFYLVNNVRTYTITAADMERAHLPVGIDSEGGSHD